MMIRRQILLVGLFLLMLLTGGAPVFGQEASEAAEEDSQEADAEQSEPPPEVLTEESADQTEGAPAAMQGQPPGEQDTVIGPGGRPLRTDYPGTEESKQARMDTDRVEGLMLDPDQPQAAYDLRIRELETRVDDLKERVFQSKTRIVLLRETLLSGNLAGSAAVILHRTDLGRAFKLRRALYSLNGQSVFNRTDRDGDLASRTAFEVFNGSIAPGSHVLSVSLTYQGSGYGVLPYFSGYEFDLQTSCEFTAREGKIIQVNVRSFEDGGITTSKEDRPNLECRLTEMDHVPDSVEEP